MRNSEDLLTEILAELKAIRKGNDYIVEMYRRAENEVPEHIRRHSMYMHDLFDMKWFCEQLGLIFGDQMHAEMDRALLRYEELVEDEASQGGVFHKTYQKLRKHREVHGRKTTFKKDMVG